MNEHSFIRIYVHIKRNRLSQAKKATATAGEVVDPKKRNMINSLYIQKHGFIAQIPCNGKYYFKQL